MNGHLSEHPLIELIREIKLNSMGGALRVSLDRHKCVAYFAEGSVIFTTSNLKTDRLRDSILRWNLATSSQLSAIDDAITDAELASKLIELGVCDSNVLELALVRQIEDTLRPCLLWTDGEWSYDPLVRVSNAEGRGFDTGNLLFEAARRLPHEFASSRLKDPNEILKRTGIDWSSRALTSLEGFLLSRLDIPIELHDLTAISGISEDETKYTAFCLLMGGLLERSGWPVVFPPNVIADSKKETHEKIRVVTLTAAPIPVKPPAPEPVKLPDINDPAVIRRELDMLFARLDFATDHYEVIGVGRGADVAEIKSAYYALARKYHPDRFRHLADEQLHNRVEASFARIAQAYEILRVPNLRSAYDSKIKSTAGQSVPSTSQSPRTPMQDRPSQQSDTKSPASSGSNTGTQGPTPEKIAEAFDRGLKDLKEGFPINAATAFSEAVKLAPREPLYRAYYGHALAASAKTRRQAEAEILSAIAMDRQNPLFYVMLAELYKSLNLFKRAQGALEQALKLDPRQPKAKALLDQLNGVTPRRVSK